MSDGQIEVTRRTVLRAALGSGALLALSACGSSKSSSSTSTSASASTSGSSSASTPATVSASSSTSAASSASTADIEAFFKTAGPKAGAKSISVLAYNAPQGNSIQALIGEFEKLTGIKVNWTSLAETEGSAKIATALGSGSGAYDVIQSTSILMPTYGSRGWLTSIDSLASKSDATAPFWNKAAYGTTSDQELTYNGVLYGAPMFVGTQLFWYRTDIFEKHGISGPPTSYDELTDICEKIHGGSTAAIALRTAPLSSQLMYSLTAWIYAYGGKYYDSYSNGNYSGVALNSPGATQALDLYSSLVKKYGPTGATNWQVSDVTRAFSTGQVAMIQEGMVFGATFNDPKKSQVAGKVGCVPLPKGPAGTFVPYGDHGWSIAKGSGHQDAAWLFVQWATLPSTLTEASLNNAAPFVGAPLASAYESDGFKKMYDFDHYIDSITTTLGLANSGHVNPLKNDPNYEPSSAPFAKIADNITAKLSLAVTGQASAASAVAQAAKVMGG